MVRFERIRDRLPSLYRPEEIDLTGELAPIRPEDLREINGESVAGAHLRRREGGLEVQLPVATRLDTIRLAPSLLIGSAMQLELYHPERSGTGAVPVATASLAGVIAKLDANPELSHFLLRLRRPGLLSLVLRSMARLLDEADREASGVMQSHWIGYADHARFSPFVHRSLELLDGGAGADPVEIRPHIDDLGRIGSLLGMLPWRDPVSQREQVESYRRRILRTVRLYREGLGTTQALRKTVQLRLPVLESAPPGLKDLPFTLEEFAPLAPSRQAAEVRGPPIGLIGPLMRWEVENDGMQAASPTVYIEGATPEPGRIDTAARPVIELFTAEEERVRLGLAYDGLIDAGKMLRIRPAFSSWIALGDQIWRADAEPGEEGAADPTAAGPWAPDASWAGEGIIDLVQAADRALWAACENGALIRFDGEQWTEQLTGLPRPLCLALDGDDLLIGTTEGLLRLPLHPAPGAALQTNPAPGALAGPAIHALLRTHEGVWLAGTSRGFARLDTDDSIEPICLHESPRQLEVFSLFEDHSGTVHLGTELGLILYRPQLKMWYWYAGEDYSDQLPDWHPFDPHAGDGSFPTEATAFLPPVRSLCRGPDEALWIGTERGIARYLARSVGGATYTTHLEAFPDLATGTVHSIVEDERGTLWFATDQGLFRFDGRDWWQLQGDALVRLPLGAAAPAHPEVPRHWRFHRALGRWEYFDPAAGTEVWTPFSGEPRSLPADRVRAIVWTDRAHAELGTLQGDRFVLDPEAAPAALRSRYKPTEAQIVEGGIPALPRLPAGRSTWRYLALEGAADPAPKSTPAWTREGRLIPPPEDREALEEGRYSEPSMNNPSRFDQAVFAYNPAARVWMTWEGRRTLTILARLRTTPEMPRIEPAILDRVWEGIEQVRPAGIRAMLAIDERIVRGRR